MSRHPSRRTVLAGSAALGTLATPLLAAAQSPAQSGAPSAGLQAAIDYAQGQKTTGFLIVHDGKTLVEKNWPVPADSAQFRETMVYGSTPEGALLEDVASQQKSFVSMLVAIAIDKGMIDVNQSVSHYIGSGWTKASPEQEAKIRVIDVLTMSSGLTTEFGYAAAPGGVFLYNTPVYAVSKRIVAAAAGQPLDVITHDWLAAPAGMSNTAWRKRPASMADIGNPTGLVTCPRDVARFGQIVLNRGKAADGARIVSEASLAAMFTRSAANPAYGRLWWLNGSAYTIKPLANHVDHSLIPAAPTDLIAALGALDRKLYIVPSQRLVVVRMGQAAPDKDFDQQLWLRLVAAGVGRRTA